MRRLYNAICGYLEAAADEMRAPAEPEPNGTESMTERSADTGDRLMHSRHRGQSIDDDDGGVYRLGFNNNHTT